MHVDVSGERPESRRGGVTAAPALFEVLMYDTEFIELDSDGPGLMRTSAHDPAVFHTGDYQRLLQHHRRDVARAFALKGLGGFKVLAPLLKKRTIDARTLFSAAMKLHRTGGKAPGPNELRLEDLSHSEIWQLCRVLREGLDRGRYRPSEPREVAIPKIGKPGEFRTLSIQNIEDRIVSRAVVEVLQPMLDLLATPFSFGFRPRLSRLNALGTATALIECDGRFCVVKADMQNAFDRIPMGRVYKLLETLLPKNMIKLIRLLIDRQQKRGLLQGCPLSPAIFNYFADTHVGIPWARRRPMDYLVRYADDLLVPCHSSDEAQTAQDLLARLCRSAGLSVKPASQQICNLQAGETLEWLGYDLSFSRTKLAIGINGRSWTQLQYRLELAHLGPCPPVRAAQIVRGWLVQMGPCYPNVNAKATIRRMVKVASELGFDELDSKRSLLQQWQLAYGRWIRVQRSEEVMLQSRTIRSNAASRKKPLSTGGESWGSLSASPPSSSGA